MLDVPRRNDRTRDWGRAAGGGKKTGVTFPVDEGVVSRSQRCLKWSPMTCARGEREKREREKGEREREALDRYGSE